MEKEEEKKALIRTETARAGAPNNDYYYGQRYRAAGFHGGVFSPRPNAILEGKKDYFRDEA